MSETMEVEFSLTPEDVQAAQRYYRETKQPTSGPSRAVLRKTLFFGVVIVIVVALAVAGETTGPILGLLIVFAVGAVAGAAGMGFFLWWAGKVSIGSHQRAYEEAKERGLMGPIRLAITADGVTIASRLVVMSENWFGILKIGTTDGHVFLYNAQDVAHVIPRRAFRDETHFNAFVDLARRYQQGTPSSTTITAAPPRPTTITRAPE